MRRAWVGLAVILGIGMASASFASSPVELVCNGHGDGPWTGEVKPRNCMVLRPSASLVQGLDLHRLRWRTWTRTPAIGVGYDDGFHPGQGLGVKVRVTAFRVRRNPTTGAPMFSRVRETSRYGSETATPY